MKRRPDILDAIILMAAAAFDLPPAAIAAATRGSSRASLARGVAMYLAAVSLELGQDQIARAFGRDRSSVSHAIRRIEDHRDDRDFDAILFDLEVRLALSSGRAPPISPAFLPAITGRLSA